MNLVSIVPQIKPSSIINVAVEEHTGRISRTMTKCKRADKSANGTIGYDALRIESSS